MKRKNELFAEIRFQLEKFWDSWDIAIVLIGALVIITILIIVLVLGSIPADDAMHAIKGM